MKSSHPEIVTASEFRDKYLCQAFIESKWKKSRIYMLQGPTGLGKTALIEELLRRNEFLCQFDIVIYMAPLWDIVDEREYVKNPESSPVPTKVVRGRPTDRCGGLNSEWKKYNDGNNFTLGKLRICPNCSKNTSSDPCEWANRDDSIGDEKIVFTVDAMPKSNPMFFQRYGDKKVLLIADEAKFLTESFARTIAFKDLKIFVEVLQQTRAIKPEIQAAWIGFSNYLMRNSEKQIRQHLPDLPAKLSKYTLDIQETGYDMWSSKFKYLEYDLKFLKLSRAHERWKDDDGISFLLRPMIPDKMIVVSAHLTPDFLRHKLRMKNICAPTHAVRVSSPGTQVINIICSEGITQWFKPRRKGGKKGNCDHLLKFFAVRIAQNIAAGKTTLLVAKLDTKELCAELLTANLAQCGVSAELIIDLNAVPSQPNPKVIPIIHFGLLGINQFSAYETCYCLNSYYLRNDSINSYVFDGVPPDRQPKIAIYNNALGHRHAVTEDEQVTDQTIDIFNEYIDCYEAGAVTQIVGRVRQYCNPREIIMMQRHNFAHNYDGNYHEFKTLAQVREFLAIPPFKQFMREHRARQLKTHLALGLSLTKAAEAMGITKSTASKWLSGKKYPSHK